MRARLRRLLRRRPALANAALALPIVGAGDVLAQRCEAPDAAPDAVRTACMASQRWSP